MPQVDSYVTQNYRKTSETSNLGTRKLAFYTFTCDEEYGLVGPYSYGYSFRVNTTTGVVTVTTPGQYISEIDDVDFDTDLTLSFGDTDDGTLGISPPWNIAFLGNTFDTLSIDSNSALYFGSANYSRRGPNDPTFDGQNVPGVAIANNDGSISTLFTLTTGTSGSQVFQIKFNGNTDYNNWPDINLTWQVKFDEANPGFIDFLVTKQPTSWTNYDDGQGRVTWGVSNGYAWVDGRSDHAVSFADPGKVGGDNWKQPNSLYFQIVRALQAANVELFWLGEPHNANEQFVVDWVNQGLINPGSDAFTFAIKDDAANPSLEWDQDTLDTISVNDYDPNYIGISGDYVFLVGQPVLFGTAIGGLTPNVPYYVVNSEYDGSNTFIRVSATFDRTPTDLELPEGHGGIPGEVVELTNDYSSTVVTVRYYVSAYWEGTSGDSSSTCMPNGFMNPEVGSTNFWFAIWNNVPAFQGGYFFVARAQPTWGIFPSYWTN